MATVEGSQTVGLGILGLGYWGPNLLRAGRSASGTRVVAACDTDPAARSRIAAMNPGISIFAEADALLSHPDVDAIVIATPPATHARLARCCIDAGAHVLVEKPLALCVSDCVSLARQAESAGLVLMVGHTFLFSEPVNALRNFMRSGELGDPYYVSCRRLNMGRVRSDLNALWNFAPHDISILEYVLGETPTSVSAVGGAYLQPGIEDVVFLALGYASGLVAHVEVSWLSPVKTREMTVVGSQRMAVYNDVQSDGPLTIHDRGFFPVGKALHFEGYGGHALTRRLGDTVIPHVAIREPLVTELERFAASVRGDRETVSDGWHGARVVAVLETAQRALRSGRTEIVSGVESV